MSVAGEMPQWKKELIARLRSQNRRIAPPPPPVDRSERRELAAPPAPVVDVDMVQQQMRRDGPDSDGSNEELRYGPGIVSRLKDKYLSLARRDARPVRRAASLEDVLDEEPPAPEPRSRPDLKRARSVEAIAGAGEEPVLPVPVPVPPANRPKRIAPVVSEREKPPADVVKQTRLIFEPRAEQRTRAPPQTGDVAAKVANYRSLMKAAAAAKGGKKPPLKAKPQTNGVRAAKGTEKEPPEERRKQPVEEPKSAAIALPISSPIPDVSRVESKPSLVAMGGDSNSNHHRQNGIVKTGNQLSETPDLIITSSPVDSVNSPSYRISVTENFLREEVRASSSNLLLHSSTPIKASSKEAAAEAEAESGVKRLGDKRLNLSLSNGSSNTMTFNFAKSDDGKSHPNHLPLHQPLKLEINGGGGGGGDGDDEAVKVPKPPLTVLEIEKNLINTAKTLEQQQLKKKKKKTPASDGIVVVNNNNSNSSSSSNNSIKSADDLVTANNKIIVPKVVRKSPPVREPENNSIVFKFTDRKDVPDYVHNDGVRKVAKIEKPKIGEGGIILLPGASIDESFTDEDEEIMRSLEGPPSPCDVTFVNDNVLIDGKSSLSQKTKKAKMKISFVDAGPEIYEYPSESSLLIEEVQTSPLTAQIRHSVPSLSGSSSLGNYTPKSTEEFHPGVSRSVQNNIPSKTDNTESTDSANELILQEVEKPILFSAGANSDILF